MILIYRFVFFCFFVISVDAKRRTEELAPCQCDQGIVGKPGPVGPQGPPGMSGIDGAFGLQGSRGKTGLPGHDGIPGIPGVTGPRGLSGRPGRTGSAGRPGSTGKSGRDCNIDLEDFDLMRAQIDELQIDLEKLSQQVTSINSNSRQSVDSPAGGRRVPKERKGNDDFELNAESIVGHESASDLVQEDYNDET